LWYQITARLKTAIGISSYMLKKTSFSIPEDLHRRFKQAATDRSLTMYQGLIAALNAWIDGTTYTPPAPANYSAAEQRRIDRLVLVMRRGTADHIDAVTEAIEQLARTL
jgi:hypothetical protein